MIPFCIDVLQGRIPEQNERKITKPVCRYSPGITSLYSSAVHVGAAYFDAEAAPLIQTKQISFGG